MVFGSLLRRTPPEADAMPLYMALVEQSRLPVFFGSGKVPDTIDGRFDLVCIHVFLALRRLKRDAAAAGFAQKLFDTMFVDMDRSLREIGVGDMGVGPRVKAMAKSLYGRIAAYDEGLDGSSSTLTAALARNLYGTVEVAEAELERLADYLRRADALLADQEIEALRAGRVQFPSIAEA